MIAWGLVPRMQSTGAILALHLNNSTATTQPLSNSAGGALEIAERAPTHREPNASPSRVGGCVSRARYSASGVTVNVELLTLNWITPVIQMVSSECCADLAK